MTKAFCETSFSVKNLTLYFNFWGQSSPDALPGLRPWTLMGLPSPGPLTLVPQQNSHAPPACAWQRICVNSVITEKWLQHIR